MKNDLVVTTWSHSSYSDIWEMYYGQYKKHASFLNHYMMINEVNDDFPENCIPLENNEDEKFYKRLTGCLSRLDNKNIIYSHEDFILYGNVSEVYLDALTDFLNQSDYSFIRLIKSGFASNWPSGNLVEDDLNLYEIPMVSPYVFSLQAAIWKRQDLIRLFEFYRPKDLMASEVQGSNACRAINMKGCYIYDDEEKRGNLHYDSSGFPYVSTALHGGSHGRPARWQMSLYPDELGRLTKEYNIDVNERGVL